mgnify:CR=1 FL=1
MAHFVNIISSRKEAKIMSSASQIPEEKNHYYDGKIYRTFIDPSLKHVRDAITRLVPNGSKIIEIGCGTGDQLFNMGHKIKEGLCIELSEVMIETALREKEKLGFDHLNFVRLDATKLDKIHDKSFDVAISTLVIHEMPFEHRLKVIKEMKRVAHRVILIDWSFPLNPFTKKWGVHIVEFMAGWNHYQGFRSYMKHGGIPQLLEQAELKLLQKKVTTKGLITIWDSVA